MSEQPPPAGQKTELHFACCRGDPKLIIEAVKKGISINALDDKQCSPLHVAARYNHTEVCRFLMSQGADMSLQDSVSWRPSPPPPTSRPCPPAGFQQTDARRAPAPSHLRTLPVQAGRTPAQVTKSPEVKVYTPIPRLAARVTGPERSQARGATDGKLMLPGILPIFLANSGRRDETRRSVLVLTLRLTCRRFSRKR
jgi:hypothetical protein